MYPKFIHYGHDKFDKDLFVPIRNFVFVKPIGGLWASPINSNYGWKDWCLEKHYCIPKLDKFFSFKLNINAEIFIINSKRDLHSLPVYYNESLKFGLKEIPFLDFELISKNYDALWLTNDGIKAVHDPMDLLNLHGWDVESLLVFNPNIIITNYGKTKN
jgi:hypothetical protein